MDSPDVNVRARPGSRILYRTKFSQGVDENGRERIFKVFSAFSVLVRVPDLFGRGQERTAPVGGARRRQPA